MNTRLYQASVFFSATVLLALSVWAPTNVFGQNETIYPQYIPGVVDQGQLLPETIIQDPLQIPIYPQPYPIYETPIPGTIVEVPSETPNTEASSTEPAGENPLQAELDAARLNLESSKKENGTLTSQINELQIQTQQLKTENTALKQSMQTKAESDPQNATATVSGLNSKIESLKSTNSDLLEARESLKTKNSALTEEMEALKSSNSDAQAKLNTQIQTLQTTNGQLTEKVESLTTTNSTLQTKLEARMNSSADANSLAQVQVEKLSTTISELQAAAQKSATDIGTLAEMNKQLAETNNASSEKIKRLTSDLKIAEAKISELKSQNNTAGQTGSDQTEELNKLNDRLEKLDTSYKQLETNFKTLESENEELKSEAGELKKALQVSQADVEQLPAINTKLKETNNDSDSDGETNEAEASQATIEPKKGDWTLTTWVGGTLLSGLAGALLVICREDKPRRLENANP